MCCAQAGSRPAGLVLLRFWCTVEDDSADLLGRHARPEGGQEQCGQPGGRGVGYFGFVECGVDCDAGAHGVAE